MLQRAVLETCRKTPGENAVLATEYLLEMSAMPTTVDPTEKASVCVKILQTSEMQISHIVPKKNALRSRVKKRCVRIAKSLLNQTNTNVI